MRGQLQKWFNKDRLNLRNHRGETFLVAFIMDVTEKENEKLRRTRKNQT